MTNSSAGDLADVGLDEALQLLQVTARTMPKPKPKITNFPLPRELRDEVYGYLVDGKRIKDSSKPFPSHKFHMNITGVNSSIRREALEYLDSQTGLVMVHLTGAGINETVLRYRVPHIFFTDDEFSEYHTGIIKAAPLIMNVRWVPSPLDALVKSTDLDGYANFGCAMLMAQQDLSTFFHVLWTQCQWMRPDAIYITSARGSPVQIQDNSTRRNQNKVESPSIILACHGLHRGDRVKQQAQQQIIQAIQNAVGCGYNFQVGGFNDMELVQKAIDAARPQIIWTAAQQWETFDMVIDAQHRGDRCALDGMFEEALKHYEFTMTYILKDATIWPPHDLEIIRPKDAPSADRWALIFFDLLMSSTWLKARSGDRGAARNATLLVLRNPSLVSILNDEDVMAKFRHIIMHFSWEIKPGQDSTTFKAMLAEMEEKTKDEYCLHDLSIYIETLSQLSRMDDEGVKAFEFDVSKLSCYTMPVRTFDSLSSHTPPLATRPARFKGWQDIEHLAELSNEDKEKILYKQIKLGFRVSEF